MKTSLPPRRIIRRRKKGSKNYFTKKHEQAILDYCASDCQRERTVLYADWIGPAFDEMVDKIVFTYKFTTLPNIDSLRDECKIWLITILDKYDVSRGSKAFSYFSVIIKNWFIHKVKKQSKQNKTEIEISELPKELELQHISTTNQYANIREHNEFFTLLMDEVNSWEVEKMKLNEQKVVDAIKILFDSHDDIEIFNKKAIYLYLREITGLNTKQVVNSLNKIRARYRVFKVRWDRGDM